MYENHISDTSLISSTHKELQIYNQKQPGAGRGGHVCNLSFSGAREKEHSLRPAQTKALGPTWKTK
jgi:hypothetical protein